MGLSGTGEFEVAEPGGGAETSGPDTRGDKTSGIDARGDKTSGPDAGGNEPAEADKRGLKKTEQKQRRREPVRSGKRNGKDFKICPAIPLLIYSTAVLICRYASSVTQTETEPPSVLNSPVPV